MRPGLSVTSRLPSGSGSTAQGCSSPLATTTTSNATFEVTPHARVCPATAGRWLGTFGVRVSSGWHSPDGLPVIAADDSCLTPFRTSLEPPQPAASRRTRSPVPVGREIRILPSASPVTVSLGEIATIDIVVGPGDERGPVRHQEQHQLRDLVGLAETIHRM